MNWLRILLLALALTGPVAGWTAGCPAPVGKDFVSARPADAAMSQARLLEMMNGLDAPRYEVRALLVLRDCKLVLERYKSGLGREHNHTLYSVTKSFASTLVGELLYEGKLKTLDSPLADLLSQPGRVDNVHWAKARQITLRNAMQMSSGLAYRHDPCCHPIYDVREDRLATALSADLVAPPGTRFLYSDGDVSLTGAAIAALAGNDLLSYGKSTLFTSLQMGNYDWMFRDRTGRYPGGWGLRARPMDILKLGQLYLQRGEWNGRRIFAADYPDLAWTPGPNKSYGLHWWIGDAGYAGTPYFYANGFKGQRIFVFPAWSLVVALAASLPPNEEREVVRLVVRGVVEAVGKGADAADAPAEAAFKDRESAGFRGEVRVQQDNQDAPRRF